MCIRDSSKSASDNEKQRTRTAHGWKHKWTTEKRDTKKRTSKHNSKLSEASASVTADSPAVINAPGSGLQNATPVSPEEAVTILKKTGRKRRNMELILMLVSAALVILAMCMVQYTVDNHLSWGILTNGLSFVAICVILNVAMRYLAPQADPFLLPLVTMLNGIGLVLINRLDLSTSAKSGGVSEGTRQIIWTFVAVIIFVLTLWGIRDHRVLSRYSYTLGLVGLILLAIPAVLPSSMSEVNGSKIWIRTPIISIQPGEFSKIVLIISIAAILVSKRELFATTGRQILGIELPRARDLAPILVVWVVAVLILVVEKDLGTSLLIFATVLTMIYIATNRVSWLLIGVVGFAAAALIAYFSFSHVQVRFATWLDPVSYTHLTLPTIYSV